MFEKRSFNPSARTSAEQTTGRPSSNLVALAAMLPLALVFLMVGGSLWWWYGWRIEPGNGKMAILVKKTGKKSFCGPGDRAFLGVQGYTARGVA